MAKYKISDDALREAVEKSSSYAETWRNLGIKLTGGSHAHFKRRIEKLQIDTSHFKGQSWSKDIKDLPKKKPEEILILKPEGSRRTQATYLRRALIESGVPYICSKCGQEPFWIGNVLTLDVDHIDGNWLDDRIHNLRFLCPNCHSQFSRNLIDKHLPKKRKPFPRKRKVERPSKDELKSLLLEHNFSKVGELFGVSDNAIRKWCLSYNLSTKSRDYIQGCGGTGNTHQT